MVQGYAGCLYFLMQKNAPSGNRCVLSLCYIKVTKRTTEINFAGEPHKDESKRRRYTMSFVTN